MTESVVIRWQLRDSLVGYMLRDPGFEVVATGGVRVTRGDVVAEAPEGRYDRVGHVLLLTGGATVRRAGDVLTAATVRITFLSGGGMTLVAEGNPQVVGAVEDAP